MKTSFHPLHRERRPPPGPVRIGNHPRRAIAAASVILCAFLLISGCESKDPAFPSAPTGGLVTIQNVSSHSFGMLQFRIHGTDLWSRNYLSGVIDLQSEQNYYFPVGDLDFRFEATDGSVTWTYRRTIDESQTTFIVLMD